MIFSELPLSFPIYKNQAFQNRFRKNCYGKEYKLLCPSDSLLPFQFYFVSTTVVPVSEWKIYSTSGSLVKDLNASIGTHIKTSLRDDKQYNFYNGSILPGTPLPCGYYEMRIAFTGIEGYYYSEVFYSFGKLKSQTTEFIKIVYRNECNIGPIQYTDSETTVNDTVYPFQNEIYLETFITHTEPLLEIETEKDGYNNELVTFSKFNNRLLTEVVVPDYLKSAILMLQLHKSIALIDQLDLRTIAISRVFVKTQQLPETSDCMSLVQLTFEDNC